MRGTCGGSAIVEPRSTDRGDRVTEPGSVVNRESKRQPKVKNVMCKDCAGNRITVSDFHEFRIMYVSQLRMCTEL